MTHSFINPEGWAAPKGYANGVMSRGGTLYIGGQIGWDSEQKFQAHDFIGQLKQVLLNIRAIVEAAGGSVEDITRLTWFVTDKKEYVSKQREVGEVYRAVFGRHFPAMTMVVVSALVEDEALVEIEATAELAHD